MLARVGWNTEPIGSLNVYKGEYDFGYYFIVYWGLPIWVSFRGCFHVIERFRLKSGPNSIRLRSFRQTYMGLPEGPTDSIQDIVFPLKESKALKWMALFHWAVFILGVLAASAGLLKVFAVETIISQPKKQTAIVILVVGGVTCVVFFSVLLLYQMIRKPRRRQTQIRSIIAERLGPLSDLADWQDDMLLRAAAIHGQQAATSIILANAEQSAAAGRFEEAVFLSRLALGFAEPGDLEMKQRAEELTDACLNRV